METLIDITSTLKELENVSNGIFLEAVKLTQSIKEETEDYLEEVTERVNVDLTEDDIVSTSLSWIDSLIKDALVVESDLPKFALSLQKNGVQGLDSLDSLESSFFQQVWLGDMYGEEGPEGLRALLKDLKNQKSKLNEDSLIDALVQKFKSNTSEPKTQETGGLLSLLGF